MHANCEAVDRVLAGAGVAGRVRLLDQPVPTAGAAAAVLHVAVGAIANSLVFRTAESVPLLVLTSGAHRVDTGRIAALAGTASVSRGTPEFVYECTGQRIGGVAPVGHPARLRTVVDSALADHPVVWAAGGIPRAVFPTSFAELIMLTHGTPADVA